MKLGMQVGLGPGYIVLDGRKVGLHPSDIELNGDPAPPSQKGGMSPNFRSMSIVHKRLDRSRCHLVGR